MFFVLSLRGLVVQIQYLMQSLTLGAVIKQISYLTPDLGPGPTIWTVKLHNYCKISGAYQLKQSVKVFHSLMLYLRLPALIIEENQMLVLRKLTFIIETIDAVDGSTLVVSSQQEKVLRVLKQILGKTRQ